MLNRKVGVWYKFIQYTLCVSVDYVLLMYTKRLYILDTTNLSNQLTLNRKNGKQTVFNLKDRTIIGYEDKLSEDLRDYLRRRGVKIFTGKNFKSI